MRRRSDHPAECRPGRGAWRIRASGLAAVALLLQLLLGPAGMLRMVADPGTTLAAPELHGAAADCAGRDTGPLHPAHHHHQECPLCIGAGALLQPSAPVTPSVERGVVWRPESMPVAATRQREARSYDPRGPPVA